MSQLYKITRWLGWAIGLSLPSSNSRTLTWFVLRLPEEFHQAAAAQPIIRDQRSNASQSLNNMAQTKHKKRKRETNDLTIFDNLPTSSGQKGEDLIQTTRVINGYQDDSKIQLEKLRTRS